MADLTLERLRELLHYDPETGIFTRLIGVKGAAAGRQAGALDSYGYLRMRIDGKRYKSHRVAWFYVHGKWPAMMLDHINQVKTDNRIVNLREVTASENVQNTSLMANNTSGYRGVTWSKKKHRWKAQITVNKKRIALGHFDTAESAFMAYAKAAKVLHTHNPNAAVVPRSPGK